MDNKKHIINLESFREMLHICPRLPHQPFVEPPFEEEILAFLWFLGHSGAIRRLTDGLYHKRNVDFAYLMWEDFVYQVEHKDTKKSNEIYYPRFTKVIIHHFMSKDPSIPRRNKVNWHYVRDDHMFSMIKLVSRHQNTQQFSALLPIELTNEDIRNSNAYKKYYAVATGATPPKPKASVQKTRSSSDTTITPPTAAAGPRLTTSEKGKQAAKASKAKSLSALFEVAMTEAQQLKLATKKSLQQIHISQASGSSADKGTGSIPRVPDVPTDESKEEISWNSTDKEGDDDEGKDGDGDDETRDEESFDPIPKTPENGDDEGNGEENLGTNVGRDEGQDEEDEADELYRDVNINLGRENDEFLKTIDENMQKIIKEQVKEQVKVQVSKILPKIEQTVNEQLKAEVLTRSSNSSKTSYAVVADLSEIELKKILIEKMKGNKSIHRSNEQRNLYKALVEAYESDKIILDTYEGTVTLKRHRDDDDDKMKNPPLDQTGGPSDVEKERSLSQQALQRRKVPGALASQHKDLNIDRLRQASLLQQRSLCRPPLRWKSPHIQNRDWNKTLSVTHESIQPWISELAKQSDSRSSFNELMDTPMDFSNFLINRLKVNTLTPELLAGPTYELMKGSCKILVELEFFLEEVYTDTTDQLDWVNLEDLRLGVESYQKKLNLTKPDTYHSDLKRKEDYIAYSNPRGFIYQNKDKQNRLMQIDELHKFSNGTLTDVRNALDDRLKGIRMKYLPHSIWRKSDKDRAAAMIQAIDKRLKTMRIMRSLESFIVEWHNYKHLDWITVRRDDDKLYKFKEGDFKRLRIQDIEDMLLLLVQGKLTNMTVKECFAFNVSLRMFIRSIVIQRRAEDLQLGVESYQKKLNLTKLDTYHSDLKCKEAYITYSNPRGFIYQNKDKQNRLMQID
nr:hypothetical protein [Tanacetum cinerariifolium]